MKILYKGQQDLEAAIKRIENGNFEEAIDLLKKALKGDSSSVEILHLLGLALANLSRFSEAREIFLKVLSIDPRISEAHYNLGRIEECSRNPSGAISFYRKAIEIEPHFLEALSSLGVLLNECHKYNEALIFHKKVIELSPNIADGWAHAGLSYAGIFQFQDAISCFNKALELDSEFPFLRGYRLHIKMKICAWDDFDNLSKNLVEEVLLGKRASEPFAFLALSDSLQAQKICSEVWSSQFTSLNTPMLQTISQASKKIRIGYFSPDFRDHAVSFLTAELFELHNRDEFEVIAFSLIKANAVGMRRRLLSAFDDFIDVDGMSDCEVAQLSKKLNIDIAVDLGGYTENCRPGIFAYRAAPIQVSYLGYLGTMGASFIDYIIADQTIITKDLEEFYSEKIIYLPSYQVNDRLRKISDKRISRHELGLPEGKFVFCCFNSTFKILPDVFDSWLRILQAIDGSILYLQADTEEVKMNLLNRAAQRGVSPQRFIFGERLPPPEYLARYRNVDLFLDTFPYNAGTTASDALWVGLPVLTRAGNSFCSRVAASILRASGVTELITYSEGEYEETAIRLAKNPSLLIDLKARIERARVDSLLFDTPSVVKNIEQAFHMIHQRYRAGLDKASVRVISS